LLRSEVGVGASHSAMQKWECFEKQVYFINIDGFYTKTTQKRGFSKLCVKIKKRFYTDLFHFSTRKHKLVSFFRLNLILTVELHRSFYINEFTVRSYEYCADKHTRFFTGFKKIKHRRISFVLGCLCMILWKISTAISIKHQIHVLATFNIKKIISDSLYVCL
jgi:hypothetical protein